MENQELREALAKALKTLDPKYRSVLVMRDVQDMNIRETAEALGISEANVKTRLPAPACRCGRPWLPDSPEVGASSRLASRNAIQSRDRHRPCLCKLIQEKGTHWKRAPPPTSILIYNKTYGVILKTLPPCTCRMRKFFTAVP